MDWRRIPAARPEKSTPLCARETSRAGEGTAAGQSGDGNVVMGGERKGRVRSSPHAIRQRAGDGVDFGGFQRASSRVISGRIEGEPFGQHTFSRAGRADRRMLWEPAAAISMARRAAACPHHVGKIRHRSHGEGIESSEAAGVIGAKPVRWSISSIMAEAVYLDAVHHRALRRIGGGDEHLLYAGVPGGDHHGQNP